MIRFIPKKFYKVIYKLIKWHHRKPRRLVKRGISMELLPTVFHPNYYLSTDILLDFILSGNIQNKSILELGCGSGFISLYLAKNTNHEIHASDINENAIHGLIKSQELNNVSFNCYHSDLFENIPSIDFDIILINPPYFSKKIENVDEYAFYTGENFEYFKRLFEYLINYDLDNSKIYMILSENVELEGIKNIAAKYDLSWEEVFARKNNDELFSILQITNKK